MGALKLPRGELPFWADWESEPFAACTLPGPRGVGFAPAGWKISEESDGESEVVPVIGENVPELELRLGTLWLGVGLVLAVVFELAVVVCVGGVPGRPALMCRSWWPCA